MEQLDRLRDLSDEELADLLMMKTNVLDRSRLRHLPKLLCGRHSGYKAVKRLFEVFPAEDSGSLSPKARGRWSVG